jgi:hypothetical protein
LAVHNSTNACIRASSGSAPPPPSVGGARAAKHTSVAESGWYDYFDHVNAAGPLQDPPSVIADHLGM